MLTGALREADAKVLDNPYAFDASRREELASRLAAQASRLKGGNDPQLQRALNQLLGVGGTKPSPPPPPATPRKKPSNLGGGSSRAPAQAPSTKSSSRTPTTPRSAARTTPAPAVKRAPPKPLPKVWVKGLSMQEMAARAKKHIAAGKATPEMIEFVRLAEFKPKPLPTLTQRVGSAVRNVAETVGQKLEDIRAKHYWNREAKRRQLEEESNWMTPHSRVPFARAGLGDRASDATAHDPELGTLGPNREDYERARAAGFLGDYERYLQYLIDEAKAGRGELGFGGERPSKARRKHIVERAKGNRFGQFGEPIRGNYPYKLNKRAPLTSVEAKRLLMVGKMRQRRKAGAV